MRFELRYESVFVMSYLFAAGLPEYYRDDVEATGAVLYVVGGEEIAGRFGEFGLFGLCDDRLGGLEGFVASCFHLNEDDDALVVDHNEVDFAGFAGEVGGKFPEAFSREEFPAAFFTPSAEQFCVSRQLASAYEPTEQFRHLL